MYRQLNLNIPHGFMPVPLGSDMHILMGGPYLHKPVGYVGIKMAEEIDAPCAIDIPTRDFDVPDMRTLSRGVVEGFVRMFRGQTLYVGCMGGIGRTGLYMAAMAAALAEAGLIDREPIEYVRKWYIPNAVETMQQREFIDEFPAVAVGLWLKSAIK